MSTMERLPLSVDHVPESKRAVYDAEPILSARDTSNPSLRDLVDRLRAAAD